MILSTISLLHFLNSFFPKCNPNKMNNATSLLPTTSMLHMLFYLLFKALKSKVIPLSSFVVPHQQNKGMWHKKKIKQNILDRFLKHSKPKTNPFFQFSKIGSNPIQSSQKPEKQDWLVPSVLMDCAHSYNPSIYTLYIKVQINIRISIHVFPFIKCFPFFLYRQICPLILWFCDYILT